MDKFVNWIYGLLSAAVGAAANGITVVIVAPESFNLNEGLPKLMSIMIVSAILAVGMYLKQSPLPKIGE
jgi:hypothetical protein